MEEDVKMKGLLYIQRQRFGKRWRKVWCVVFVAGRHSAPRMEMYGHKQNSECPRWAEHSSRSGSNRRRVIRLSDCISIVESPTLDCPRECAAFLLETTEKLYMFAAHHTEHESWLTALCDLAFPMDAGDRRTQSNGLHEPPRNPPLEMKSNSLYESVGRTQTIPVVVVRTEASARCNLHGEYDLTASADCLLLKDPVSKELILTWPYCFIRKFGQDMVTFSFEAGRRCSSGEGHFLFATSQGQSLFSIISAAVSMPRDGEPAGVPAYATDLCQPVPAHALGSPVYSTDKWPRGGEDQHTPQQAQARQQPCKKLTSSFRSLSLNATEPPSRDRVRGILSCPPMQPQGKEVIYAKISRPQHKPSPAEGLTLPVERDEAPGPPPTSHELPGAPRPQVARGHSAALLSVSTEPFELGGSEGIYDEPDRCHSDTRAPQ